jgi:hypothetical protein
MKCAEVNCYEQSSTAAQVELDGARFAVPLCETHDIGDVRVVRLLETSGPAPADEPDAAPAA